MNNLATTIGALIILYASGWDIPTTIFALILFYAVGRMLAALSVCLGGR